jgi:hypothetical protein
MPGRTSTPEVPPVREPAEYDLKVDTQVEKFLETKHKLTWFLVTASVAVIAFLVNFVAARQTAARPLLGLVIVAAVLGLLTAGLALLNLHCEMQSYQLHIRYRYQRRTWDALSQQERTAWEWINRYAAWGLRAAFILLFGEMVFAVAFFVAFLR